MVFRVFKLQKTSKVIRMNRLVLNFVKASLDELEDQTMRIQRAALREYILIETIVRESFHLLASDERVQISETLRSKS